MNEQPLEQLLGAETLQEHGEYPEESAGAIMSRHYIAVGPEQTVAAVRDRVRQRATDQDNLEFIYLVDSDQHLIGSIRSSDLLRHDDSQRVDAFMRPRMHAVTPEIDQEEANRMADRFELSAIPVVDRFHRLLGTISADKLKAVVQAEAAEDIQLMSGVAPGARQDESVFRMISRRLPWLLGGLCGAGLAALVVGSFEQELARAAILASFIPVVMAMAGNVGIQASTLSMQGLTAGELSIHDFFRRGGKEFLGAMITGLTIALVITGFILLAGENMGIQAPVSLSWAVGASLVLVMIMAASFGGVIPLLLDYAGVDPALATGIFITTINDILSVLIFFVIATQVYQF